MDTKNVTKSFRVNESENKTIQEKAKLANMDESTFIRTCALNNESINIVSHNAKIAKELCCIESAFHFNDNIEDEECYKIKYEECYNIMKGFENIWQLLK